MKKQIFLPLLVVLLTITGKQVTAQTMQAYLDTSESFYNRSNYDSALYYAWRAAPMIIDSFGENSTKYAWFTGQYLGINHEWNNNLDSAFYWYLYSIRLFEALNDTASANYGEALNNHGNLLNITGSFTQSLPFLTNASAILERYSDKRASHLATLNNLANYYQHIGEYPKAENYYGQCLNAIDLNPNITEPGNISHLLYNMAVFHSKTGNVAAATKFFQRSIDSLRSRPDQALDYYTIQIAYGVQCISMDSLKTAETVFTKMYNDPVLKIHNGDEPQDQFAIQHARAIAGFGDLKKAIRDTAMAEKLYQQAIGITQKLTILKIHQYYIMGNLAHLYASQRLYKKADSLYTQIMPALEKMKDKEMFYYLQLYAGYCENLLKMQETEKAGEAVQQFIAILMTNLKKNLAGMANDEQMKYITSLQRYTSLIYSVIPKSKTGQGNIVKFALNSLLQLKGLVLSTQIQTAQSQRHTTDTTLKNLSRNWLELKELLYTAYSGKAMRPLNTDSLETLLSDYERKIATVTGIQISTANTAVADNISNRLHRREAAIEYVYYTDIETNRKMYGAFVMRHNEQPVFIKLCAERQIENHLYMYEAGKRLLKPENQLDESQSHAVYNSVWKSVAPYLAGADTVYYSPAGLLSYISFEALSPDGKKYLMESKKLVLLSGTQNLLNKPAKEKKLSATVLWGNIEDGSSAAYAYQSGKTKSSNNFNLIKDELPDLKKLLQQKLRDVRVFENKAATEANFKQYAGDFKGILHLSAHGFYFSQPESKAVKNNFFGALMQQQNPLMRCGLLLHGAGLISGKGRLLITEQDGVLTGYEITLLDLSKVNLVVLSACETGLGDIAAGNEGVLGLQRAFRLAGADKMVLTLWDVNAELTIRFMEIFYKKLLQNNNSGHALRAAKAEMAKESPPYGWAGFMLVE